jgi:hypothetical protein
MTEDEYRKGQFTDGELDYQADMAAYWQAVKEFFLEWEGRMDRQTSEMFRRYLLKHHLL